jgi:hypothetical protein
MVLPCLSVGLPGPGSPPPAICPSAIPEALGAGACVAIDGVHTLGPVAALVGHAVVVVCLAELPAVARDTVTPGTQVERGLLPQRLPASCGGSPPPLCHSRPPDLPGLALLSFTMVRSLSPSSQGPSASRRGQACPQEPG